MGAIIDSDLPQFPANNSEELKSVFKLLDLFDLELIKPDAKIMDKYPATDGVITVVNSEQSILGKFDIQIKTLPDTKLSKPVHQCEKSFLKYCEESQLPVLLIAVNVKAEKAWWLHVSRELLRELAPKIKKNSIAVHFPTDQFISRTEKRYTEQWTEILTRNKSRLYEVEKLTALVAELEKKNELLASFPKPIHTIPVSDIKKLFIFLDTLNDGLNRDFNVVKQTLYRNYRQLGLAYSIFKKNELEYAIYPVKYGQNDLALREVKDLRNLMKTVAMLETVTYYGSNPIKDSPAEFAYSYLKEDVFKILKGRYIKIVADELCQEYIADFLEYGERIFRFNKNKIDVPELYRIINEFVPLWCEVLLELRNEVFPEKFDFDLDNMLVRVMPDEKNKVYRKTIKRFKNGDKASLNVRFVSGEVDFDFLFHAINKLLRNNVNHFVRPFPLRQRVFRSGLVYDWYDQAAAFEKVKFIFEALPSVFDEFMNAFFPVLTEALGFYSGRNLVIVNFHYPLGEIKIGNEPHLEVSSFRTDQPYFGPGIKIYLNGEGSPIPGKPHHYWKKGVDIDGVHFNIISSGGYPTLKLYSRFTLMDFLFDDLLSNFTTYFNGLTKF